MTFREFSAANRLRCARDFGEPLDETSAYGPVEWALMIAEEAGEVAGAVIGAVGLKVRKSHLTAKDVGDEIADVIAYCDLLAGRMGLDLETIVRNKFNRVSERIGSAVKLPTG